jgi:hypothetical protein
MTAIADAAAPRPIKGVMPAAGQSPIRGVRLGMHGVHVALMA